MRPIGRRPFRRSSVTGKRKCTIYDFHNDAPIKIRRASAVLLTAYGKGDEFLYVRIDDAPDFIQLPQ